MSRKDTIIRFERVNSHRICSERFFLLDTSSVGVVLQSHRHRQSKTCTCLPRGDVSKKISNGHVNDAGAKTWSSGHGVVMDVVMNLRLSAPSTFRLIALQCRQLERLLPALLLPPRDAKKQGLNTIENSNNKNKVFF